MFVTSNITMKKKAAEDTKFTNRICHLSHNRYIQISQFIIHYMFHLKCQYLKS